jgi:hypothetical protein
MIINNNMLMKISCNDSVLDLVLETLQNQIRVLELTLKKEAYEIMMNIWTLIHGI